MSKAESMVDRLREYSQKFNEEMYRENPIVDFLKEHRERQARLYLERLSNRGSLYSAGVDPFKEDMESKGSLSYNPFPIKELMQQIDNLKNKKMKTKKFYHTFPFKGRGVTICLLVKEQGGFASGSALLSVGYSVSHPDDEFNEELGKKIALGRAEKPSANIEEFGYGLPSDLAFDLAILQGFSFRFERLIKNGEVTIKGIKDVEQV